MAVWSEASTTEILATRRIDAEFSQPKYLEAERKTRSCKADNLGNLGTFVPGPFGSAFRVSNYDFQSPYRYIRGQDVKPFFILEDDSRFIPQADFIRLQHYAVKKDDLMISVVGTLGNVAVCTERETPAMFSCKSTIFRSEKVDPYYLLGYLNSHFGQLCLLRRQRGAIQMGLNIEDLRSIPIPRIGELEEGRIAEKVRNAHDELISSRESYQSAQQLLESELGLDKLSFQKPVGYTTRLSELELSRRTDAEFYHIKYEPFLDAARNYKNGCNTVGQLTKRTLPNFDAGKHEADFDYIEIGDISTSDGTYGKNQINAARLPANAKIKLSGGEILISQVRPTRGAIAVVQDHLTHESICSGAFYVCTANDPEYREIIWLYLRSIRIVFEKYCDGTSYPTIDSRYISKFPVPLFDHALAEEIKALIRKSKSAKQESEQLLEQAKTRVEQLIEEAVQS